MVTALPPSGARFNPPTASSTYLARAGVIFGTAGLRISWFASTRCRLAGGTRQRRLGDGHHRASTSATFLVFVAATSRPDRIATIGAQHERPTVAAELGGEVFFAFVSAIAFATILAVVAGLTISASTSFAHDFYTNVLHRGAERGPGEEVRVARATAFVVGAVAISAAILLGPNANVAFLVALAFAVAASANLPVIVLSLLWRRFNTTGAVAGLATGLAASIIRSSSARASNSSTRRPSAREPGDSQHPARLPGVLARSSAASRGQAKFDELIVRANTGSALRRLRTLGIGTPEGTRMNGSDDDRRSIRVNPSPPSHPWFPHSVNRIVYEPHPAPDLRRELLMNESGCGRACR